MKLRTMTNGHMFRAGMVKQGGPSTGGGEGGRIEEYDWDGNRYATDFAGLTGRDLIPQGNIELPVDQTLRIVNSHGTVTGRQFSWSSLPPRVWFISGPCHFSRS